jgi:hypothetical protein
MAGVGEGWAGDFGALVALVAECAPIAATGIHSARKTGKKHATMRFEELTITSHP